MKRLARRRPVIAVRVSRALHGRITKSAKQTGRSMSEQMSWLIENGLDWDKTFGDRDAILEAARHLIRAAKVKATRVKQTNLPLASTPKFNTKIAEGAGV